MRHTSVRSIVLASLFFAASAEAQVIFQPSTANCSPDFGGTFKFCKASPVAFIVDSVTPSSSRYLTTLPVENTLTYKLFCPSFPEKHAVALSYGDITQTLIASSKSVAERARQTVPYSGLSEASYVFAPSMNYSASIKPTCKMEVIGNQSIPNVNVLRTVVDLLKEDFEQLNTLTSDINAASELPAKWVVIKNSPQTLDGLVDSLANEIEIFKSEQDALNESDKSTLSQADLTRLEELPGLIELYSGMVNDLKNLKTDLGDVEKIASQCETNTTDAFCLDQVSKISKALKAKADLRKADLVEINTFLTAESDRLKTAAITASNALKRLITKF